MERKSFKPPEARESSEDDDNSEADEKENTTSTRPSERHTEKADGQQEDTRERWAEAPRSLWRRVTQELVSNDEPVLEESMPKEPTAEDPTRRIITEFAANLDEENGEEVPLGHLNTIEQHEAAKAFIELRQQEIEEELGNLEPKTVEARAATVAEHLLEATQQELDADPTIGVEEATDHAYHNTVRADLPETPEAIAARAVAETEMHAAPVAETGSDAMPERFAHYLEDDNQDIRFPTPEVPNGNSGNGSSGGNRNRDFQRGFGGFGYSNMPFRRRLLHDTANRTTTMVESVQARRQAAAVGVVAGVVGYLIGRRSGRIKTEKRLMAVQKKLEAEVRTTYARLQGKETQIRELTYTRLAPPPPERIMQKAAEAAPAPTPRQEKQPVKPLEPTEHLGKTTLKALEARPAEVAKPQNVEAISQQELIEMSEHITVGATNLRKVYETNLVSERGLRRIVGEYRRGGDVRRALAEEMLKKEMSYERDPMLRDKQLSAVEQATGGGRQSAVQPPDMTTERETTVSQVTPPAPTQDMPKPSSKPPTQPALVMANAVALAILAVLIIVLIVIWMQKLI